MKLYEYIAARSYIFCFGSDFSEVRQVLEEIQTDGFFPHNDTQNFIKIFSEKYYDWKAGKNIKNTADINRYSTTKTAKQFAELMGA
jgi:hypothetical protein